MEQQNKQQHTQKSDNTVKHSLHLRAKVYEAGSRFVLSIETCTRSIELQTLQNNLGFSLYAMLSIYHGIATLEDDQNLEE